MSSLPRGVVTALLTPFDSDGNPDLEALAGLIEFQVAKGVAGLFVLGTAGQGPMLEENERAAILRRIVAASAGRLKVIAHIGAMPTSLAVKLTGQAIADGVDAVSSVPPVYYQPNERAVDDYYATIKDIARDTPLLAYNNPPSTGYDMRPAQIARLHRGGIINGVKQASANIADLHHLLNHGVPVWMANAACAVAALAMGAEGMISTITNVAPEKFVAIFSAMSAADIQTARKLQHDIDFIANRLRQPIIGALHAGASLRGLRSGVPRAPLQMPIERELADVKEAVALAAQ
jgi:dihydrodipicolinate synthase/N-acetylneuraminate lyase